MEKYDINIINDGTPKYIQLYKRLKALIESGKFAPSEKLPPIRMLSQYLEVNTSTVVKAYALLEKERYIYKKEKSGSFVYPQGDIQKSGEDSIRFDLANPKAEMFPVQDFKTAVSIAIASEGDSLFDYQEGLGYPPLRSSIKDYLGKQDIITENYRLQIISGAQQGINIIAKTLLSYGDVVFTEEPTYPGAIEVFREHGIKIVGIPMLDDGLDMGVLKQKLTKMKPAIFYVMPNFQNPTGISYSQKKKKQLLQLAEKYDFIIVEDDSISDFRFHAGDTKPLRAYDNFGRTIYIKSFSKILMPGLRIGFMELPLHMIQMISRTKYSMDISTSSFTQLSLYYYMKNFNWERHLLQVGQIYQNNFEEANRILFSKKWQDIRFRKAQGGINFFGSLPRGFRSLDLKNYLESIEIRITEGNVFYPNLKAENDFRISIAHMNQKDLESNLNRLHQGIRNFIKDSSNEIKYISSEF